MTPSTIEYVKRIVRQFGERRLNEIPPAEWFAWIDGAPDGSTPGIAAGLKSSTRERILNTVCAFLKFATLDHGLAEIPKFRRDRKATNPNRRARRRVEDLRPELIRILFNEAHISTRAQLAVEVDTGARVSSVLHGARICDLTLTKGRAAITFRNTKTGHDVRAVLSESAARILREYLLWRGDLYDREAPLFLTPKRLAYSPRGKGLFGTQNKAAFKGARRRAVTQIRMLAAAVAKAARAGGFRELAHDAVQRGRADATLLGRVTQHWFRHRLATLWLRKDPRAAMEQGGWLDIRSLMGYAHDVPEYRRRLADELDPFADPPAAIAAGDRSPR